MDIREKDKAYIWHPFTQMKDWLNEHNVVIERGEGNYLIDTDGKRYLDGVSSLWVNLHGHNNKTINDAIEAQLKKIAHSTMLGLTNVPATLLAERLIKILPSGLTKVFYSDNGSTSVEVALKMAFQYWQHKGNKNKTKFAFLNNSYHGDTIGAVSVGGIELFHSLFKPLLFNAVKLPSPYCYRCEFSLNRENCAIYCLKKIEDIISEQKEELCAVIMEPLVQGAAGMLVHFDGFLKRISELCKKNNILLILDEVATGFGRTGKMFASLHEQVTPDLICLSKGISGGYLPLAATVATDEIFNAFLGEYEEFKTFFHGHSYTGNSLACAAGLASLDLFEKENCLAKVNEGEKIFEEELKKFLDYEFVGEVRRKGYMIGVEIVKDRKTKGLFAIKEKVCIRISHQARKYGVFTRPLGNVLVMVPPLSITKDEIKLLCDAVYKSMRDILG